MGYKQLISNGVVILIITFIGLIFMYKFKKDDNDNFKKEQVMITSPYGRMMRDFFRIPLFILGLLTGLCLIYNGWAIHNGWPILFNFLFVK